MKLFKKLLILPAFLVFTGFFTSIQANDCVKVCEKFVSCTEELNKRKATAAEKDKLNQNCAKTCAKKTAQVLGCFSQGNSSCQAYAQCIITQAQAQKKK
jgi:Cys-rich protein (TIGR04453 family)